MNSNNISSDYLNIKISIDWCKNTKHQESQFIKQRFHFFNPILRMLFIRRNRLYSGFSVAINKLLREGRLEADKSQEFAINYLNNLANLLEERQEPDSFWNFPTNQTAIKGGYIYGSVGSGKTMLMDKFYEMVQITEKRRLHYNQFMLKFHSDLGKLRDEGEKDPVKELVRRYCEGTRLLCLDEFQVRCRYQEIILFVFV